MAPALAAGLIVGGSSLLGGGLQGIFGGKRRRDEEKRLKELYANVPQYQIPDEYKQILASAKGQLDYQRPEDINKALQTLESQTQGRSTPTRMPGQDLMEQQLAGSTGRGVRDIQRGATSAAEMLAATQGLYSSQNRALADIQNRQMQFAEGRRQQEMARMDAAQRNLASTQIGVGQYEQGVQSQNLANYQNALMNMGGQRQQQFQMNQMNPWQLQVGAGQANLQGAMNQQSQGWNTAMQAPVQGLQTYMMSGGQFGQNQQAPLPSYNALPNESFTNLGLAAPTNPLY